MRAFTALELDEPARDDLASMCHGLPGVRWVDPSVMHLTLHYLGEDVREEMVREALDSVQMPPAFSATLSGVGRFLSRNGGAIWVGLEPCEPLLRLHESMGRALRAAGLPIEKRKFQPHITLGRIRSTPERDIHTYLEQFAGYRRVLPAFAGLTLFESQLRPDGPVHTALEFYEFT
jgi:2'-5' RNA ligase